MVRGILVTRKLDDTLHNLQLKMEHADLVAEMKNVENMPTQERLQLARLRRSQQLKMARQKEKEWLKSQRNKDHHHHHSSSSSSSYNDLLNSNRNNSNINNSNSNNSSHNYGGISINSSNNRKRRHIAFENSVVLLEAASRNDVKEVAELLQQGITPDAANEDGLTALHQCCIDNNVEMLKLLLEYGANIDAQDSDKWTPLHAAATCGHLDLVRILIDNGANLLAVNTDGNMPYDLCDDENTLDYIEAEMSKRGVTQELIDETRSSTERQMLIDLMELARNGGDLEEPDYQGATPLHIAAANGYVRVVEFLLEMHVNIDALDRDKWSPVHAAACWGHLEVLEMLAHCGADLNIKNKDNETPSDICEDPEMRERIEQLKTEQESKRLAEAQQRRVRRSQSNNTRAQSVRRTSLRDKTLTTKKDAVEEAKLRLQAAQQEVFITPKNTNLDQLATSSKELNDDAYAQNTSNGVGGGISTSDDTTAKSYDWEPSSDVAVNSGATTQQQQQQQQHHHYNHINNNNNQNHNNNNNSATTIANSNNKKRNNFNDSTTNNSRKATQGISQQFTSLSYQTNLSYNDDRMDDATDSALAASATTGNDNTAISSFSTNISRRPPEGRESDDIHTLAPKYNTEQLNSTSAKAVIRTDRNMSSLRTEDGSNTSSTTNAIDAVEVQSSKKTANSEINVQVTVLVDSALHYQHVQHQQQQHQHTLHYQQHQLPTFHSSQQTAQAPSPQQQQQLRHSQSQLHLLEAATTALVGSTLANLKKQRSLSRVNALNNNCENGSTIILGSATGTGTGTGTSPAVGVGTTNNNRILNDENLLIGGNNSAVTTIQTQQPNSGTDYTNNTACYTGSCNSTIGGTPAAVKVNKFSGITGDVVGDSTRSKTCCTLM